MARLLHYICVMLKNLRHISILFVLLMGVLGNVFASNLVHDASKICVEKSAVGCESIKAWEAMISKAYRTDISLLQRMSDDIIAEPTFYTWIKNNASKLDGWKVWMGTYNSLGDPVKNILGSGRVNHATEWNQLINEIEAAGGEVIFRPGTIAYSPGIKKGVPGQLIIDQDASITALRHEHRHFLDDQAAGYKGFEGIFDPNFRITTEYNAYKLEVVAMKDLGHTNVANQLKTNFQQEVNDIMSKMGTPNQTILNLIDELVNL